MDSSYSIRPAESADLKPAFHLFRHSLWDLLERTGIVAPGTPHDIEATWRRQRPYVEHLARQAAAF